jgi:hypothetical protein
MARTEKPILPKCEWLLSADEDAWRTDCGEMFQFAEGGPQENGFKFCCYCGQPLRSVRHHVAHQDQP